MLLSVLNDRILIVRSRQGDTKTFDTLMRRHRKLVESVCRRFFGSNDADVEDAVQETAIRAFRSIVGFRNEAPLESWLCRIAHNVCVDLHRRNRQLPASLEELQEDGGDQSTAVSDATTSPEAVILSQQEISAIMMALNAQLAARDFQIVMLIYQFEMTSEEVGHQLGMSAVNIRKRHREVIRPAIDRIVRELGAVELAGDYGSTP